MIKNEPLISASPPDQHEDDARGDVPTPDRTGDAALHIEAPRGSADGRPAQRHQDNLFFYHFLLVCLPSQHLKERPVLLFRFLLCHKGLNNVNTVCSTVRDFPVLKRRSVEVILIFLWRDKSPHLFLFGHFYKV